MSERACWHQLGCPHGLGERLAGWKRRKWKHEPWYPAIAADGFCLDAAAWSQLGAWGHYDPSADLDQLTTPTLAIFGGNDPLVPIQASIQRLRQSAERTGRPSRSKSSPAPATVCRPGPATPPDT